MRCSLAFSSAPSPCSSAPTFSTPPCFYEQVDQRHAPHGSVRQAWKGVGLPSNSGPLRFIFASPGRAKKQGRELRWEYGLYYDLIIDPAAIPDCSLQCVAPTMLPPSGDRQEAKTPCFWAPFLYCHDSPCFFIFIFSPKDYACREAKQSKNEEEKSKKRKKQTNQAGKPTPRNRIVHQFFVRSANHAIKPRSTSNKAQNAAVDTLTQQEESGQVQHYRVFGMTARIIVDAARVAFAREPEFEHNSHFGDEEMIAKLRRLGRLSEVRRPGDELTREMMERAAKLS